MPETEKQLSLSEIEVLIKQTDYNTALKQLYMYIQKNPNDFDRAQVLIDKILTRRQQYSILTERAIRLSEENPEDHETPAKIILEMRGIEKNPPSEIKYAIDMLEELHLFKYYAYMFDSILEEGAELTKKNQSVNAIKKLHEGFWIYKDEFEEEWKAYPEIIDGVKNAIDNLEKQIALITDEELSKKFDESVAQFVQAVNSDNYISASNALLNVKNYYYAYAGIQNDIVLCGMQLSDFYKKQKEIKPEIADASYIPFITRFVLGMNSLKDSGINGAILYKIGRSIEDMKTAILNIEKKYYNDFYAAVPTDLFSSSPDKSIPEKRLYLNPIRNYTKLGCEISELYNVCINSDGSEYAPDLNYSESLKRTEEIVEASFKVLAIVEKVKQEDSLQKDLLSLFMNKNSTASPDKLAGDIDLIFDSVIKMNEVTGSRAALALENQSFYKKSKKQDSEELATTLKFTELMTTSLAERSYKRYIEQIFKRANSASALAWNVITAYYQKLSDSYISDISQVSKNVSAYNEGFSEKIPKNIYSIIKDDPHKLSEYLVKANKDPSAAIIYRYPSLCLTITSYITQQSDEYIRNLSQAQEKILANFENNSDWKNVDSIKNKVNESDSYLNSQKKKLASLKESVQPYIATAQEMYNEAYIAKSQAEDFMANAEADYKRGKLDSAQKNLQLAGEKYALSLSLDENEDVSRESDLKRIALDEKITDAKNTLVVQQSREYYNLARDALNYNRFDDAERYTNAAVAKWAETHTESNPEFESFRILVTNAVSMESGRELHQSDALYEDMSQLLNIANQYYQTGVEKIQGGDPEGGKDAFNEALSNLDKLKKVYPLNHKAFLLRMNIEKIQNPQKYAAEFKQKIQDAVNKCDNPSTAAEGLGELKGYYEQDSYYPGLAKIIENMEVKLGRRQKKAGLSDIAKSNEKYSSAQRIFNSAGSDSKKLNDALNLVNEALQINPNNNKAVVLKDKIATKIGGSTSVVLTSDEQQLLTLAKNEYGSQNIEAAYGYILLLYERNPQCSRIKDVNDTRRRIESRL